jgi:hypothetical protein
MYSNLRLEIFRLNPCVCDVMRVAMHGACGRSSGAVAKRGAGRVSGHESIQSAGGVAHLHVCCCLTFDTYFGHESIYAIRMRGCGVASHACKSVHVCSIEFGIKVVRIGTY